MANQILVLNASPALGRVRAGLEGLVRWDWLLLVATAPVLLLSELFPAQVVAAAFGLLGLYLLAHLVVRCRIAATPLHLPLLFLVLMIPVSLWASSNLQLSLPKLSGLVFGIASYLAFSSLPFGSKSIWIIIPILLISELGLAILGLFATQLGSKLTWLGFIVNRLPHAISLMSSGSGAFNPNEVAGAVVILIPLTLTLFVALIWSEKGNHRSREQGRSIPSLTNDTPSRRREFTNRAGGIGFIGFVAALAVFTLLLAQSRSALFGLGIALIFLASLTNKWLIRFMLVAVIVALVASFVFGLDRLGQVLFGSAQAYSVSGSFDFASRMEIWQRAIYMLQDFPFTGIGLSTFSIVANTLYPFFLISADAPAQHAHNLILQVGVDLGIPGLVAYIGLITSFFAMAWRLNHNALSPLYRAITLGLAGGMLAFQVFGLTDAIPLGGRAGLPFWMMLGLMDWLWVNANSGRSDRPVTIHCELQTRERTSS